MSVVACGRCGKPFWSTDPKPPELCSCVNDLEAQLAACRNALRASESRHASDSEVFEQRLDAALADAAAARGVVEAARAWFNDPRMSDATEIALGDAVEVYEAALDAAGRAAGEVA